LEVVKALHSLGADVNVPMNDGATQVFITAAIGNALVLRTLVSLGGDVNMGRTDLRWTQWYVNRFDLDPEEEANWTPLMIAARNGHAEVVKVLVEAGASIGVELSGGRTALSLATAMGHTDVAAMLAAV
jgi:ankyrin repeat protein